VATFHRENVLEVRLPGCWGRGGILEILSISSSIISFVDLAHRRYQDASVLLVNLWCRPDSLNGDVVLAIRVRHKIDRMDATLKNTFERELLADVSFGVLQDLAN
jgi:hypothetical protein